jgi:hypothetical protein
LNGDEIVLPYIQLKKRVGIVVLRAYEPCMRAYRRQQIAPSHNVPKFLPTGHLTYGNALLVTFIPSISFSRFY